MFIGEKPSTAGTDTGIDQAPKKGYIDWLAGGWEMGSLFFPEVAQLGIF
jgi:hypothetical protein